jgi:hypothetical protein
MPDFGHERIQYAAFDFVFQKTILQTMLSGRMSGCQETNQHAIFRESQKIIATTGTDSQAACKKEPKKCANPHERRAAHDCFGAFAHQRVYSSAE